MNRAAIAVLAAGAIVTAAAAQTLKQARWQLRDLRILFATMEEDHSQLVKLYLDTRRRLHVVPAPGGIRSAEQAMADIRAAAGITELRPDITPEEIDALDFDE